MNNLKSIILSAGKGERLKPLTNSQPKGLVSLFGKSILERQIETYRNFEINDISIVTGYFAEKINFKNISYFNNQNYSSTNMLESLFCAEEKLTDSVIISYGDIIFESKVLKKLIDSNDDISVVIDQNWAEYWNARFEDPLTDAESLIVDELGFIQNIGQKVKNLGEIQGQYIGLMKFQNDGIRLLRDFYHKFKDESQNGVNPLNPLMPFEKSYFTDFLQSLIDNHCKLKAVPIQGGWLELDSINDYHLYSNLFKDDKLNQFIDVESLK